MKEIWMLRHGQTDLNVSRVYFGSTDVPLNETGIQQALNMRNKIPEAAFDVCYTSPLIRASVTGKLVYPEAAFLVEPGLAERDLGKWEGLSVSEIQEQYPKEWLEWRNNWQEFEPPEGESFLAFWNRVTTFLDMIRLDPINHNVLLVTHSGPIRCFLAYSLGMPYDAIWRFSIENACMSCLKFNDENFGWLTALNV